MKTSTQAAVDKRGTPSATKRQNGRNRGLSDEQLLTIHEIATLTRAFEDRTIKLSKEGFIPPLLHPGAGQEVGQLAALAALRPDDPLLYAHRGVAYLTGRGITLEQMLADMAGREGGTNNGKGGIMHVADPARGVYGQSGTLGGGFVIAAGMGMALKKQKRPEVVVHFFGDGASNRGTFHESLNWAAVQKLPVILICENNGWAVSVPASASTAVEDIAARAAGYGVPGVIVDGGDPDAVFEAVAVATERARRGEGPSLIELKCTRLMGHYATDPQDYRKGYDRSQAKDSLKQLRERLIENGLLTAQLVNKLEEDVAAKVELAVDNIKAATLVSVDHAFTDLFV